MSAPVLTVTEIQRFERPVTLRLPFRFGVVTVTEAREAVLRVRITRADGRESWGTAAEVLAAKWFDKNPALSDEDNMEQLRRSLRTACSLYLAADRPRTAFDIFADCYPQQVAHCAEQNLNALIAGYGPALLDRAILDALCRAAGLSFYAAIQSNLPGIRGTAFAPLPTHVDLDAFLAALTPAPTIHARHTIGLVDPITAADQSPEDRVGDGLPETLEEVCNAYGHRYFKVKVSGDNATDLSRLAKIARVLDRMTGRYYVSLDGNEQYDSVDAVISLWQSLRTAPSLARFAEAILFVEQPIKRQAAASADVSALAALRPVIIDESDADFDAFPEARSLGYSGVSSKTCKGIYRSLINLARCRIWHDEDGRDYFLSAEDLTTLAGISVQQDLALVNLLGLTHVERNGHHYVRGMAGRSEAEQHDFLTRHGDLYHSVGGTTCLHIRDGMLQIGSLDCAGFASAAEPDWSTLQPMVD